MQSILCLHTVKISGRKKKIKKSPCSICCAQKTLFLLYRFEILLAKRVARNCKYCVKNFRFDFLVEFFRFSRSISDTELLIIMKAINA